MVKKITSRFKCKKHHMLRYIVAIAAALIFILPVNSYAIEIIANSSYEGDTISKRELRAIFGIKLSKWNASGEIITVVSFSNENKAHRVFCKEVLNIFPHQLAAAWDRVTYTGIGQAPIKVKSIKQMLENVSRISGAIGYIDDSSDMDKVSTLNKDSIKILRVE